MSFLSYIMSKLAWIIPACALIFVAYVFFKNKQSDDADSYIKQYGVDVDAEIVDVNYDKYQRVNNKLVAIVTVKYKYKDRNVLAKRGLNFFIYDKDKFEVGNVIKIRINQDEPEKYYYVDYRTY